MQSQKNFILVVEDKASLEQQAQYEDEQQTSLATDTKAITSYAENGALHYAQQIIAKTSFKQVFAIGCSGDEKHHLIRPIYVDEKGYKLLDRIEGFQNFSAEHIERFYREQVLGETPPEILAYPRANQKVSRSTRILEKLWPVR